MMTADLSEELRQQDQRKLKLIADEVFRLAGGEAQFIRIFPELIREAVEYVIDPVRTARTRVSDLDNVEKTFIGLKVEHFLRDFLGVPKGLRDFRLLGEDVDVKNTVRETWMIPPETFRNAEPCLLVMVATEERRCSIGIMIAREDYLNQPNRDGKRSVRRSSFEHIHWMIRDGQLPDSRFEGLDMVRFRELRAVNGGTNRVVQFFRENAGKVIHRTVLQALLFDQKDYMKRVRGNGGARDILMAERTALFSGLYHSALIAALGLPACDKEEFMAHRCSEAEWEMVLAGGYLAAKD